MSEPPADTDGDLIPGLPNDVAARCIALIPMIHHPHLSLVCRSWLSFLRSPLFSSLRVSLRATQPLLLLSLRRHDSNNLWLLLRPGNLSSPQTLPSPPLPTAGAAVATIGSTAYLLGGCQNNLPTTTVQILDARSISWSLGPRMRSAREFAAASAFSHRIYAFGGCSPVTNPWAEELDVSTDRWVPIESPPGVRDKWMHGNAVLGGRILAMADRGGLSFDPVTREWSLVSPALDLGWRGRAAVVGGVLYTYDFLGKVQGYDVVANEWKPVKGVDRDLPRFLHGATLADFGGLLCLVWDKRMRKWVNAKMEIEMAGVEVTRMRNGELYGSIVWRESVVLDTVAGSLITHCVSLEL